MGFLDKVIRFFEEITGGRVIERPEPEIQAEPEPDFDDTLTRKFVAALLYCGGKKQTYFALTFEDNDQDREQELLNAISEQTSSFCSEIRDSFGYSEESGFPLDSSPEYPEIEIGQE